MELAGPSGLAGRHVCVLINRNAGTVRALGPDEAFRRVRASLGRAGAIASIIGFEGDPSPVVTRLLEAGGADVIIAGGGDGTIASVAGLLEGRDTILGVLPLGTLNVFARALGYATDLDLALEQMSRSRIDTIDVGKANGRTFLLHVSFGFQPRLARLRERIGYRNRITKMLSGVRALVSILVRPRRIRLSLVRDGVAQDIKAHAVMCTNNELGGDHPLAPKGFSNGVLGLYLVRRLSIWSALPLMVDVLQGRWASSPRIESETTTSAVVSRPRRWWRQRKSPSRLRASLDGEVVYLASPVAISIVPKCLQILRLN